MTIKPLLVFESFISLVSLEFKDLSMGIKMLLQENSSPSLQTSVLAFVILNPVILQPHMSFHAVSCRKLDLAAISFKLSLAFGISHRDFLTKMF
mmetsp:Transcript_5090/g.4879  ORF Transcript_5090/g.4879 Transcript_5090/m.4879 type:complete len:94 (-) Transcript_5090:9-290(-)